MLDFHDDIVGEVSMEKKPIDGSLDASERIQPRGPRTMAERILEANALYSGPASQYFMSPEAYAQFLKEGSEVAARVRAELAQEKTTPSSDAD